MIGSLLLQIQDTAAVAGEAIGDAAQETSFFQLLVKGGWLMIPIAIMSVVAIYIFVERFLTIKKASQVDPQFMKTIKDQVFNGNIDAAKNLCRNTDSPIARMIEKGLMRIGKPLKGIEVAIENVGNLEISRMERNLAVLATISGAAPMTGFLGTVTGMISVFSKMTMNQTSNLDIEFLTAGIYEALVTTATGLLVGIIAYIGYNYLITMVEKVVYKMEANSVEFMDLLQEPSSKEEAWQ